MPGRRRSAPRRLRRCRRRARGRLADAGRRALDVAGLDLSDSVATGWLRAPATGSGSCRRRYRPPTRPAYSTRPGQNLPSPLGAARATLVADVDRLVPAVRHSRATAQTMRSHGPPPGSFFAAAWAISLSPGAGAVAAMSAGLNHGFRRGYTHDLRPRHRHLDAGAGGGHRPGRADRRLSLAFTVVKWAGVGLVAGHQAVARQPRCWWRPTARRRRSRAAISTCAAGSSRAQPQGHGIPARGGAASSSTSPPCATVRGDRADAGLPVSVVMASFTALPRACCAR